ncbi:MAG: polysaccharide pyruvyl transferase family protein [Bacteroidia bacterium]|nr:polysaccharide pyruvyl transferase family protein [Bacteroidia bacterium]
MSNLNVLISGWFSFEGMGATAGDLIARDLVGSWLDEKHIPFEFACLPSFGEGILWEEASPEKYSHVIFVCGPYGNGWPITEFLEKFKACKHIGLNLTMLQSLDEWNPFDFLLERDSSRMANPDFTLAASIQQVPVVGLILAHKQKEYGENALHEFANSAFEKLIQSREMAVVPIDTALENNAGGLRTPAEVENLIARMDLVLTTRLHGTVLSLKNGVPPIPIDPIRGGAKISRQVMELGWPILFHADQIDPLRLSQAFDQCLESNTRKLSQTISKNAKEKIKSLKGELQGYLLSEKLWHG